MTFLTAQGVDSVTVGQSGIYAILGYAVVFFGLILLMVVVTIMGKIFVAAANRKKTAVAATATSVVEEALKPVAPGSAGALKLYNVEPKTAAMIMAIVANKLDKPLNELRFISIKEVN